MAVQLLRALAPTRIVALDARESAVRLALAAGADEAYVSRDVDPAALRAQLGRYGATLVLDFVGVDETLQLGASLLGSGGHLTLIGLGGGSFPMASGLPLEWSVSRISNGTVPELARGRRARAARRHLARGGADRARGRDRDLRPAPRRLDRRPGRGDPVSGAVARGAGGRRHRRRQRHRRGDLRPARRTTEPGSPCSTSPGRRPS